MGEMLEVAEYLRVILVCIGEQVEVVHW